MFQQNCRIEKFNGIRFYEQDILYDDYIYSNDIQIVLNVNYVSPGIGIALMNNEGMSLQEQKDIYLFRLGYREATVVYRLGNVTKKLSSVSTTLFPPQENLKMIFQKTGKKITVAVAGYGTLIEYMLVNNMDKYSFGIYSNAGNIIDDISIASSIPDFWNINIRNTNGGHLKFFKNGFSLSDCKNNAEIEQENISLNAGDYIIRYDTVGDSDIKCYVMISGNDGLYDEDKNIMRDNKFTLYANNSVNIKFKGKYGTIQNIHITDKITDKYVSTKDSQTVIEGSYITIDVSGLTEIEWKGTIYDVPFNNNVSDVNSSSVFINDLEAIPWSAIGVLYNKEYSYAYNVSSNVFTISDDTKIVYKNIFFNRPNKVTIFKNMDAAITKLLLIKTTGEITNLIADTSSKKYVPASITSPILVVDEEDVPLELSSSYRIVTTDKVDKYIFTNYEREIFNPDLHIKLTNKPSKDPCIVRIYGIPYDAIINYENIFRIPHENMDTISLFCSKFEIIREQDLHYLDIANGEIYFENLDKYKLIVVDYLKRDSYCINFISSMDVYEVDISSSVANTYLVYDHKDDSINSGVSYINSYRITDITPENKSYIVLKREGF
jgi:hypothetical protein